MSRTEYSLIKTDRWFLSSDTPICPNHQSIPKYLNSVAPNVPPNEYYIKNDSFERTVDGRPGLPGYEHFAHVTSGIMESLVRDNSMIQEDVVFFAGHFNYNKNGKPQRNLYYEMCCRSPDLFKIRETRKESPIGLIEHKKYLFLIDLLGHTYSCRSHWLLLSKRLVFRSGFHADHMHWWEHEMIPGMHYVEVAPDLSDLKDKMRYYRTNEQIRQRIVRNAFSLGCEYFMGNRFRDKLLELLLIDPSTI